LKAEAQRPVAGQIIPARTEAPPLVPEPLAKNRKCGTKAPRKTGMWQAPHHTSVRGRRRGSAKAVADWVLFNVEPRASDKLLLMIRQSFKVGRYSPSTKME
jgi:hypothetical protein